jgi:hypothetical protein
MAKSGIEIPKSFVEQTSRVEVLPSSAPSGPNDAVSARKLPHDGFVFLDALGDGTEQILHSISLERHVLPASSRWKLEFGEDGFGVVIDLDDEDNFKILEEMFSIQVFELHDGGYVFESIGYNGIASTVFLDEYRDRYQEIDFSWEIGTMRSPKTFKASKFRWERNRGQLYFSALCIYTELGFDMFEKYPWRWWRDSGPAWHNHLSKLGLHGHIVASRRVLPYYIYM